MGSIHENNRGKKSHATVPLNKERREDDLVGEEGGGGEKYKKGEKGCGMYVIDARNQ
jgi:hypothetical protein